MLAEIFASNADIRDALLIIGVILFLLYAGMHLFTNVARSVARFDQVVLGAGLASGFASFLFAW